MSIIPLDRRVKPAVVDSAPTMKTKAKPNDDEVDLPTTSIKLNKTGDVLVNNPILPPLKEERSKTVAMLFGRMNPPTRGHEENIEGLKKLAKQHNADHVVVASHSTGDAKNPLTPEQKLKHLTRAFPDTNITMSSKAHPTILHHASELHRQGYKHLIVAGGGDRAAEYHKLLNKYNGVAGKHGHYQFDSIQVQSTGERKEGVSGTDMRKHVKSGNFEAFRNGLPSKIRSNEASSKELFNDVKGGLKEEMERTQTIVENILGMIKANKVRNEELGHDHDIGTDTLVKIYKALTPGQSDKKATKESPLNEVYLHDPDTYLRIATQARQQGKILRAALLTRIAAAVRRRDMSTAATLRADLPATQE